MNYRVWQDILTSSERLQLRSNYRYRSPVSGDDCVILPQLRDRNLKPELRTILELFTKYSQNQPKYKWDFNLIKSKNQLSRIRSA